MALSGSIDFNMTASDLITRAVRKLNVVGVGQPIPGAMAEEFRIELNAMLKSWMKYEWLWKRPEQTVALVADQASYALSPRAYRVINCRYKSANGAEIPMFRYTQQGYDELSRKDTQGVPTQFYPDNTRNVITLFVWPVLNVVTTETVIVRYQSVFDDVDVITEDVDVEQEHFDLVYYNLASRMADDHGQSGDVTARVIKRAAQLLEDARDENRELFVRFVPEERFGG